MANTYTIAKQIVCGDVRMQVGTLTMSDGSGGLAVPTGLNNLFYANAMTTDITRTTLNCSANGSVSVLSATSGLTFQVFIIGQ